MSWENFYDKVGITAKYMNYFRLEACYYERQKFTEAGMKAIDGALGALMRDKIEQSLHYDPQGIPKCLLLR